MFLWKDNHGRGIHWKQKAIIQRPRQLGGLGIRSVSILNSALLLRKAWWINQNPHLLLAKLYNSFRLPGRQRLINHNFLSWGRKGILTAENVLMDSCRWKVGTGVDIHISDSNWLPGGPPLFRDNIPLVEMANLKVAHLKLPNFQGWDSRKINQLFEPASARRIQSLEPNNSSTVRDIQYWPYTKSENYNTRTGYDLLYSQQIEIYSMTSPFEAKFFRSLWGSHIMPEWKFFLWRLWYNALATSQNPHKRAFLPKSECPICLDDQENLVHLFCQCPAAIEAWD